MRGRRAVRVSAVLGALVLAFIASGCGVSTGGPAAIPKGQIPQELLAKNPPTTTTTTTPQSGFARQFNVYLANANNQLVSTQVFTGIHTSLRDALNQNLFQPNASSQLFTYLSTVALISATPTPVSGTGSELVTINLNSAFDELSGTPLILAVGQLVLTATNFQQVSTPTSVVQVAFQVESVPINVPLGTGTAASGPVTSFAYLCLVIGSCSP